jgi:hypothetical protein
MTAVLVAENETTSHSAVVRRDLTARNIPARAIAPRLDEHDSSLVVTPTREAFVPRSRLFFRSFSRAMSDAYVITPPFGSVHIRTQWTESEHNSLQD